jgi:putative copper resistance protein D
MRVSTTLTICLFWSSLLIGSQNPGGSAEGKKLKNPVPANAESVAAGAKLYQRHCAFCHGKDGAGNGPMAPKEITTPPSLIDDKWDRGSTDGEIFLVLRDGAGPKFEMKSTKGKIPEQDLWHVVNYVRSLRSSKSN